MEDILGSFKFGGGAIPGGDIDEDNYDPADDNETANRRKGSMNVDGRINQSNDVKLRSISYAFSPLDLKDDNGMEAIKEETNDDDTTTPGINLASDLARAKKKKKRSNSVDRLKIAEIN